MWVIIVDEVEGSLSVSFVFTNCASEDETILLASLYEVSVMSLLVKEDMTIDLSVNKDVAFGDCSIEFINISGLILLVAVDVVDGKVAAVI